MMKTEKVEVKVTASVGTYKTSRVRGLSASCTLGPEQAARALGRKLYGDALLSVTEHKAAIRPNGVTYWAIKGPLKQQAA